MNTNVGYVTNGVSEWSAGWSGDSEAIQAVMRKRGRTWLRKAGIPAKSDDLAILASLCNEGMSELYREMRLDSDYEVAGEVLDRYVTDHDAELLCELVPLAPEPEVGGMTREVTAVHSALLRVCGAMREAWEERD